MTRDYAKKNRPRASASANRPKPRGNARGSSRKPAPSRKPGTGQWLVVVAVTSAFVGFVVYLNAVPPEAPGQPTQAASRATMSNTLTPAAISPQESVAAPREPEYRFYDILPESEVIPPDVKAYNPGRGQRQQFEYVLQTGSFRTLGDAQRQKAQIGFQGLRADVAKVSLDSGGIWYRVQVGPYQSRSNMNSVIDRLVTINIQPMVRKRPLETATP